MRPYAIHLLERFRAGDTASEVELREGIPLGAMKQKHYRRHCVRETAFVTDTDARY